MNAYAKTAKPMAAIVGGLAVTVAAVVGAVAQGAPDTGPFAGDMSTGVTVTATEPTTAASIPMAEPEIKGPAPLPVEQQGVPG